MERSVLVNSVRVVGGVIVIQILLTSACVGSSPCMPEADPLGRYTISGGSSNIWSHGTPSGSAVHVSVNCDADATAQSSVTSQCMDGTWTPAWPRCEKPCSVPTNREEIRQFVNGSSDRPVTLYDNITLLPHGTELVARCRDPGTHRLIGDQRRTCLGGQWSGQEPQCQSVGTEILFDGAPRGVDSNGTVVVPLSSQSQQYLDVTCMINEWRLRNPRLTTPSECTNVIFFRTFNWGVSKVRLDPITTECSGIFTCRTPLSSHSVHVIFRAGSLPQVPCMYETDPLGRYTISGGSSNIWSHGTPNGSVVHVSVNCDSDATAQPSVTSQCQDGTWMPAWPRCEKPCSVPTNREEVRQFVNGSSDRPVTLYDNSTLLPHGTELVARCRDPGTHKLIGDQIRTCLGGQWSGQEPQCLPVQIKVQFYGAPPRVVASNGTVVFPVSSSMEFSGRYARRLSVVCRVIELELSNPRLITPPECTNKQALSYMQWSFYGVRLDPITTECSGIFTCRTPISSHSVHVIFTAAECEVPSVPEHGGLSEQDERILNPGDIVQHGTILYFECNEDYDLIGSSNTTCHIGEWSRDPPVCEESSGSG